MRRAVVFRDVEVDGRPPLVDVAVDVEAGVVTSVAPAGSRHPQRADHRDRGRDRAFVDAVEVVEVVDGAGGALIPGLHDHHVHLLAMAAARRSVDVGPPVVLADALRAADASLAPGTWLRAVGHHERDPLDRFALDRLVPDRPVRVQHRSGALWVLNSRGLAAVGIADHPDGRLFGGDDWLRARLPDVDPRPDLVAVGDELLQYGVTGVTDATPFADRSSLDLLASASLRQDLVVMTGPALDAVPAPGRRGPVKLVLADHDLPTFDAVVDDVARARRQRRAVAMHCVTRDALALAIAAFATAGPVDGDRIEHGAVVPPDLAVRLAELGLTVVTQPNFVRERGDAYLVDVAADDLAHLYPCATLLAAGVAVGGGTDAPFGHPDPWRAVAAAVERTTASGRPLGLDERVGPARALDLFLTAPDAPGGPPRRVTPGTPCDLVLLAAPLAEVLRAPSSDAVVRTTTARDRRCAATPPLGA